MTGSSKGIGRATALALAAEGWNIVVHGRSRSHHFEQTLADIESRGVQAKPVTADLEDPQAGPRLVSQVWDETGGVDAWVHLAGVDLLTGPYAKIDYERKLALAWTVDVLGTILTSKTVGQRMAERGSGAIVTIGWDQAATGMEGDSGEIFAASKGAIMAFSRSLAKSLAPNVRVNCVAPGWIKTEWGTTASDAWQQRVLRETPLKRWGKPQDIANLVAFLVSDRSEFLTGQILNVNGGVVM